MSPARKLGLQAADHRTERALHDAGRLARDPASTQLDLRKSWNLSRLGRGPWVDREDLLRDDPIDNLEVVREVTSAFTRLGIPYALGGSWASSLHGEPRSTRAADITVEPFPGREPELVAGFGPDYYVSLEAVKEAVREARTFNIINTVAGFKVGVFVRKDSAFARSMMARRAEVPTSGSPGPGLGMVSAEAIILLKLKWYRLGGEISERQWLDILGIFRVQADRLDQDYLDHWAADLGVADLLGDARRDAAG